MRNGILIGGIVAIVMFFIARSIANTGIMGNGYYGTIIILITFLIWTMIACTLAIINEINRDRVK